MASKTRTILGVVIFFLIATIVITIVLAFLYAEEVLKTSTDGQTDQDDIVDQVDQPTATCDDVAIVGAGIAGSYAAWRLRDQNKKITVYEYSDRIGGRCHTIKFPDIPDVNIELGAMKFKPLSHPLLNKTVHELGLTVQDFEIGNGYHPDSLLYLRGQHLRYKDLEHIQVPYHLDDHMRIEFDRLNWEIFANHTNINPDLEGFLDDPMNIRTKDGVKLSEQSRQGFYFKYLNVDTAKYLQDVGIWDGYFGDVSAAWAVPVSKPAEVSGPPDPIKTVATGFQSIPETMIKEFMESSDKHILEKNHHLRSIIKHGDKYTLTFAPTETLNGVTQDVQQGHYISWKPRQTCAKQIILAVGRQSLANIDWDGLKQPEVEDYIHNSVFDVHAGKLYFSSPSKWWEDLGGTSHYTVSDTPLRQTFDYAHSGATGNYVLTVGYMDSNTHLRFWRELKQQGIRTSDHSLMVTQNTVDNARKILAKIYNVTLEEIPTPPLAVMGFWDSYPYGAAWYSIKPGYDWEKVQVKMLRPSATDDVFIPSNAFSGWMSGWTEGALERVESALKYFHL